MIGLDFRLDVDLRIYLTTAGEVILLWLSSLLSCELPKGRAMSFFPVSAPSTCLAHSRHGTSNEQKGQRVDKDPFLDGLAHFP